MKTSGTERGTLDFSGDGKRCRVKRKDRRETEGDKNMETGGERV